MRIENIPCFRSAKVFDEGAEIEPKSLLLLSCMCLSALPPDTSSIRIANSCLVYSTFHGGGGGEAMLGWGGGGEN